MINTGIFQHLLVFLIQQRSRSLLPSEMTKCEQYTCKVTFFYHCPPYPRFLNDVAVPSASVSDPLSPSKENEIRPNTICEENYELYFILYQTVKICLIIKQKNSLVTDYSFSCPHIKAQQRGNVFEKKKDMVNFQF